MYKSKGQRDQYADDTTLILDGSEESLLESLKIIDYFGNISGLRLNSKKTEALWISKCADWDSNFVLKKTSNGQKNKNQSVRGMAVNRP